MRVDFLSSSAGATDREKQFATSFVLGRTVALDAGSLGNLHDVDRQRGIRHVLLSHTHIDHIASLPTFLENVYTLYDECPTVYGGEATLKALRDNVFNDVVWPDFVALSERMPPFLCLEQLEPGATIEIEDLRITPVPVEHPVPTFGFIVDWGEGQVVFSSDTGPTEELWQCAQECTNLRAVFIEVSFPDELGELALTTGHLTPAFVAREIEKIPGTPRCISVHMKPAFHDRIVRELEALEIDHLEVGRPGTSYYL